MNPCLRRFAAGRFRHVVRFRGEKGDIVRSLELVDGREGRQADSRISAGAENVETARGDALGPIAVLADEMDRMAFPREQAGGDASNGPGADYDNFFIHGTPHVITV